MVLGSHNSWSYLKPKKWWMKVLRFTARCQDVDIYTQYEKYDVKCFDLRVRYDKDELIIAHGIIEYKISENELLEMLKWLNKKGDVLIRLIHEVRSEKEHTEERVEKFAKFCSTVQKKFKKISFWCGMNLMPKPTVDYDFGFYPTCEELYASVCSPKIIDDWYPRWFAINNNAEIKKEGTDKDILLIDFVNIG